jgi:hypothetical protein
MRQMSFDSGFSNNVQTRKEQRNRKMSHPTPQPGWYTWTGAWGGAARTAAHRFRYISRAISAWPYTDG